MNVVACMEHVGKKKLDKQKGTGSSFDCHAKDFRKVIRCLSRGVINFDLNCRSNEPTMRKIA